MKGMTLGQYYPADSVLHRMDPRIKILCTIAFIVASFLCVNFFAFILLVASAVALIFLSRIPLKVVLRSVRPLIFIMAFTAVCDRLPHAVVSTTSANSAYAARLSVAGKRPSFRAPLVS